MSAYVVMLREQTTDQAEMATYASLAPLAWEGRAETPLVTYGALTILESPAFEGCLIHRFASVEEAEAWYHSPQYQQAVQHRHRGAQYRVFIVEGIDG
ncbi:conserved hypothetical protein [Ricinus communis]|uniref:DUF1330 domain-containing protein n=1 Tax=Ricinus communis TaxID=3988 RepID=B9TH43_RICCO|nr:conserved hypothetical protein [Ricinus communis]